MNLKDLREKALAATPGPWRHEKHEADQRGTGVIWSLESDWEDRVYTSPNKKIIAEVAYASDGRKTWRGSEGEEFEATSEFIASCNPQTVLGLLDMIEEMRKALKEIEKCDDAYHYCSEEARDCLARIEARYENNI